MPKEPKPEIATFTLGQKVRVIMTHSKDNAVILTVGEVTRASEYGVRISTPVEDNQIVLIDISPDTNG